MTKVSLILPTKNVENNIEDLLSSAYHQDFLGEIETIILDSSNVKTPEIAKRFPVEFIRVEEDNYNLGTGLSVPVILHLRLDETRRY